MKSNISIFLTLFLCFFSESVFAQYLYTPNTSLNSFFAKLPDPSAHQIVSIYGHSLTSPVQISVNYDSAWEISVTDTYSSTLTLNPSASGSIPNIPVKVRMKAGLQPFPATGYLYINSLGANSLNIPLKGRTYSLSFSAQNLSGFVSNQITASEWQPITVTSQGLSTLDVTAIPSIGDEINNIWDFSNTTTDPWGSTSLTISANQTFYVRLRSSSCTYFLGSQNVAGIRTGTLKIKGYSSNDIYPETVLLSGELKPITWNMSNTLTPFVAYPQFPSATQSFVFTATNLTAPVRLETASGRYKFSYTGEANTFLSSLDIQPNAFGNASQMVYIRLEGNTSVWTNESLLLHFTNVNTYYCTQKPRIYELEGKILDAYIIPNTSQILGMKGSTVDGYPVSEHTFTVELYNVPQNNIYFQFLLNGINTNLWEYSLNGGAFKTAGSETLASGTNTVKVRFNNTLTNQTQGTKTGLLHLRTLVQTYTVITVQGNLCKPSSNSLGFSEFLSTPNMPSLEQSFSIATQCTFQDVKVELLSNAWVLKRESTGVEATQHIISSSEANNPTAFKIYLKAGLPLGSVHQGSFMVTSKGFSSYHTFQGVVRSPSWTTTLTPMSVSNMVASTAYHGNLNISYERFDITYQNIVDKLYLELQNEDGTLVSENDWEFFIVESSPYSVSSGTQFVFYPTYNNAPIQRAIGVVLKKSNITGLKKCKLVAKTRGANDMVIPISGTVYQAAILPNKTQISNVKTTTQAPSELETVSLITEYLLNNTFVAKIEGADWELSENGINFSSQQTILGYNNVPRTSTHKLYVRIKANTTAGVKSAKIVLTSNGAVTKEILLSGEVTVPMMIVSENTTMAFTAPVYGVSSPKIVYIEGWNLEGNVDVNVSDSRWEISSDNYMWSSVGQALTLVPVNGEVSTSVYVRFRGSSTASSTLVAGTLTISSVNMTAKTIQMTGQTVSTTGGGGGKTPILLEKAKDETDVQGDKQFKAYPNPTKGKLQIDLPANIDQNAVVDMQIITSNGKVVASERTNANNLPATTQKYFHEGTTNGVYILKLVTNKQTFQTKVIKN